MNALFRGFWASTMATSSMTLALFEAFKKLPIEEKQPLPPAQLTESLVRKAGFTKNWSSEMQAEATMLSHYGYGAAAGIAYALLADKVPGNSLIKGGLFGLGVWAASYYGIIPSLKLSPSAEEMGKERNAMMALTHVVWGASLGFAEHSLRKKGFKMLDGQRGSATLH
jgi:uncharacterized membrane protein YagU involved in acid resistance